MKIATWNVNSIRVRLERVVAWLEHHAPDVLCLQELKAEEKNLPREAFEKTGYHCAAHCQKTYNGVAILSRHPLEEIAVGLDDGEDDPQARLIAATVRGVRVISAYMPNGQAVGSEKFHYKLRWMERLRAHLERRYRSDQPLALCGDFNVAPEERDVHDPKAWENETLFHVDSRNGLARLQGWGFVDTFRRHHAEPGHFSWWDYRMGAFPRNLGLRIDHVFATDPLAGRSTGAGIDREARKGPQPSDHAPVWTSFELP